MLYRAKHPLVSYFSPELPNAASSQAEVNLDVCSQLSAESKVPAGFRSSGAPSAVIVGEFGFSLSRLSSRAVVYGNYTQRRVQNVRQCNLRHPASDMETSFLNGTAQKNVTTTKVNGLKSQPTPEFTERFSSRLVDKRENTTKKSSNNLVVHLDARRLS